MKPTFFSFALAGILAAASLPGKAQSVPQMEPFLPSAVQSLPQIRAAFSQPVYVIHHDPATGAPLMPKNVVASAQCVNFPPGTVLPSEFIWHTTLQWNIPGFSTKHAIGSRFVTHASPYPMDLSEQVRGGTLVVVAKATIGGKQYLGWAQAKVMADNPPRRAIFARLPKNRWGLIASKIGMVESGLRQFSVSKGQPGGMPEVSTTRDIGLMQLNAPSGAITSEEQVWDWRENLKQGLQMLEGKHRTSQLAYRAGNFRNGFRVSTPIGGSALASVNVARALVGLPDAQVPAVSGVVANLSNAPGSGILPGDPDPDKLSLSQIERDAIRRYNGGREYSLTPVIDPSTLGVKTVSWLVDPTRGGINHRSGNPHYVLDVLKARSGFQLPAPVKPKAKKAKTSLRHKRRHSH